MVAIDPAWQEAGILVDDVIVRLNGQRLERPEQAASAFQSLLTASEIKLAISRSGEQIYLRYLIE